MTSKQWVELQNQGRFIQGIYNFFIMKGGKATPQEFQTFTGLIDLSYCIEIVDKHFGVTKMYDKQNQLLKIWE